MHNQKICLNAPFSPIHTTIIFLKVVCIKEGERGREGDRAKNGTPSERARLDTQLAS